DADAARTAVERVVSTYGRLDVVVSAAGVLRAGRLETSTAAAVTDMINVNVLGGVFIVQAAVPHLVDAARTSLRGVADVVNISSVSGRWAMLGAGGYTLTKFAVHAFSETLRQELADRRVRVAVVAPGAVDTELVDQRRRGVASCPLDPSDVADAIVF